MKHDPKEVFKALPHVQTIWVTDDGEFHLHPHNGGEEINRKEINVADNEVEEQKPIKVINQRPQGRPKHKK